MIREDKVSLSHRRAELVTRPTEILSTEARVRVQGELSLINAKIKALNTTEAAQLKARADQRRFAGLAEAQANAAREQTGPPAILPQDEPEESDAEDSGQATMIDAWIDAVLLRHDVNFTRSAAGKIRFDGSAEKVALLEILIAGIYATAQGEELPELPSERQKPKKTSKPKKR
jgi:hypothetical protein